MKCAKTFGYSNAWPHFGTTLGEYKEQMNLLAGDKFVCQEIAYTKDEVTVRTIPKQFLVFF